MKKQNLILGFVVLSLSFLIHAKVLVAEESEPGVARISLINGEVSTMRGDSGDWVATTLNAPLVPGDKVSTGARSRTEIELDHANVLRLDQQSEAKIADLTRTRLQIQLAHGLITYTVFKGNEADIEIDTPNVAVRPLHEGTYRIQVNSDSETEVIVHQGQAEVSTPQGSTRVEKGDLITVQGTEEPQYHVTRAPGDDDWDRWNQDRDRTIQGAQSWRYANSYYTGTHDLDRYGHWTYVPGYDYVWSPYADPDWAPYRQGRWVWEPYWGWTWVSYEPWGWAPYHYGRWFYYGSSWCWWPGPIHAAFRPIWAPAYVSFFGFGFGGRHWGFGFGFGYNSIGWLPVGPCDYYYPWYGSRYGYRHGYNAINVTNITNVRNITNINNVRGVGPLANGRQPFISNVQTALSNARARRALTTVSTEDFVRGRIPRTSQAVNAASFRQAQLVAGTVPAVPTRDSLRPVNRTVNPASLPARSNNNQRFFTRSQPPAGPQPFATHAAAIQQMVQTHNPLDPAARGIRIAGNGNTRVQPSVQGNTQSNASRLLTGPQAARPSASNPSSVRPNSPTARPGVQGDQALQTNKASVHRAGWSRFGQPANSGQGRTSQPAPIGRQQPSARTGASSPARNENPSAQPTQPQGWQRFGSGSSQPVRGREAPAARPQDSRPTPSSRSPESPRKFESAPARSDRATRSQSQFVPGPSTNRPNWQRVSNAGNAERSMQSEPTSRPDRGPGNAAFQSRPSASRPSENRAGWERFTPQARASTSERSSGNFSSRPQMESRSWNRFPSRAESAPSFRSEWRGPAAPRQEMRSPSPRSFERPPLEMRKPIVTERAPRAFSGGGNRGAPSGGFRVEHSGSRSAPPASSNRSESRSRR